MDNLFYSGGVPFAIVNVLIVQLRKYCYVNNAHRSIVLAARLLSNAPFDKVCPETERHPGRSST